MGNDRRSARNVSMGEGGARVTGTRLASGPRTGLPDHVDYVYKGTGADTLTGHMDARGGGGGGPSPWACAQCGRSKSSRWHLVRCQGQPDGITHGSENGGRQHRQIGEQPCEACKAGQNAAVKARTDRAKGRAGREN